MEPFKEKTIKPKGREEKPGVDAGSVVKKEGRIMRHLLLRV